MSQSNLAGVSAALASTGVPTQERVFDLAGLARRINRQLTPKFVSARADVVDKFGSTYVTIIGQIETTRRKEFNDFMASIISPQEAEHISAFMYSKEDNPGVTFFETDPMIG